MARPRKGHEKHATEGIALRVSPDVRQALDEIAEQSGRSITEEMRDAIAQYINAFRVQQRVHQNVKPTDERRD